ncbi:host attachment protein [Paraburkholderia sartisoli]|uniref:Protein required for attachment to host cells n=1 Tax=Paraburkholderia sartisoli TaxID=83784 RepID=A0A1H4AAJ4_9BURK|nr:host attachment protein [Paraburkholderia sartisoli]SEA32798.1 Protein required for attachment to host cells [Paraburkholderia sartisoli]
MTTTSWVVVADGNRARIFEASGLKLDLREIEGFTDPQARTRDPSLRNGEPGQNAKPAQNSADDTARDQFARMLVDYLDQGRLQQRFQRLRLAIEPRFLGLVRRHMTDETRKLVFDEISGDLSKLAPKDIQRHLEQHG